MSSALTELGLVFRSAIADTGRFWELKFKTADKKSEYRIVVYLDHTWLVGHTVGKILEPPLKNAASLLEANAELAMAHVGISEGSLVIRSEIPLRYLDTSAVGSVIGSLQAAWAMVQELGLANEISWEEDD